MTLTDVLVQAATHAPAQAVVFVDGERRVTYAELYADALRVAGGLHKAGLTQGDHLVIVAEEGFLPLFWGAVVAGIVPVPLPPEERRIEAVSAQLGGPMIARDSTLPSLLEAEPLPEPVPVSAGDVAFLQYSSGSTGAPKGVELTHGNLVANLAQASEASGTGPDDVVLTWMPYFHDMGLIGTHLGPLYARCKQVRISPMAFAKRPEIWLRAAHEHRATVLTAANFALAMVVRRVPDEVLSSLDLGAVRLVMVGAEPISVGVWRSFSAKMELAGLDPRALQPVYGLAEATLAVAFPPLMSLARPVRLSRVALARGVAVDGSDVELMDVGFAVRGCEIRIVDDGGEVLESSLVGHIQVRGANVVRGYRGSPGGLVDGWLETGDIGFLRGGRLCVTGRAKDVVFVHGRNFHATDLEEVAAGTPGLGDGPIAVVGATDPVTGRERVVVFLSAPAVREVPQSASLARARVAEALGYDAVGVEVVPRGAFVRTTSGKLRRHVLRERILAEKPVVPAGADDRLLGETSATIAAVRPPRTRAEAESAVRAAWSRVLKVPAHGIGDEDRFFAIGGSSLAAMEVLAELEDVFGQVFNPAMLRDCATVPALADRLLSEQAVLSGLEGASISAVEAVSPSARGLGVGSVAGLRTGEVAVIGMACRFPGADSPERFWQNLLAGRDSVADQRGDLSGGAFLADPALFDAGYFGIGESEARYLDPHARIFLELAHEALERSGYAGPRRRGRRIGVFVAVGESAYSELFDESDRDQSHALTGTLRNLTAARVAHLLDLHGPALAVDTACSSGLVALHLARRSLAAGDCDLAVVGGVNLNLTDTAHRLLTAAQALSPTGRCRAFDADADGFVPGEGGAALVLSRFADAGDRVLAVVRGTAVNNDGRSLSLMAPNPLLQQQVITDAYRESGVDPAEVTYIEAHGTGTAVGDPIEARSLAHAFPDGRPRSVGSVKTNIGHLLNAAGMPALVKVILALQHGELPPSLHHHRPNPRFDLAAAGFEVLTSRRAWPGPRVAAVNSFGFGGTNAHAILASPSLPTPGTSFPGPSTSGALAPAAAASGEPVPGTPVPGPSAADAQGSATLASGALVPGASVLGAVSLLTLSARSAEGLRAAADQLAAHLRAHPELREADVCATASTARDDGPYRLAIVARGDLVERLETAAFGLPSGRPSPITGVGTLASPMVLRADHDLLVAAGEAWRQGAVLDRSLLDAGTRRVELPTYPFQRRRYWVTDPNPPLLSVPHWVDAPITDDPAAMTGGVSADFAGGRAEVFVVRADLEERAATAVVGELPRVGNLVIVTHDLYATGVGTEKPDPGHAVWSGLAMALADENKDLRVRIVDLTSATPPEVIIEREAAQPFAPGSAEIVAWRAGRRLTRTFVPAPAVDPLVTPPDGCYLITGGAGAAGASIARHLARRGRPNLLLAGRSPEPVALLDELRRAGAVVEYRRADVAVDEDVTALVSGRRFDVVVHAAGVARAGSLRVRSADELDAGMAAKVRGIELIAGAVRSADGRQPLIVALSSVSAVLPGLAGAVGDYVAGNAYLDAFAAAERVHGRTVIAVDLPVLAGGGLAAGHAVGGEGLPLDLLPEVLWSAAALGAAQVLVTPPLPRSARTAGDASGGAFHRDVSSTDAGESPRDLAAGSALMPSSTSALNPALGLDSAMVSGWGGEVLEGGGSGKLTGVVREMLAGALGKEPGDVGLDEPFLSLGLDSLTAVDLVKELEERMGRTLSTTLFFEFRTVRELVGHLGGGDPECGLSPVQRAFWTNGRLYPDVPAYAYVRQTLAGPVDAGRLAGAFAEIERRHPMLRARLGGWGQRFEAAGGTWPKWFSVVELDRPVADVDAELRNRAFDLETEAPVRAVLAVAADATHLILVAHHAVADGYSLAVLGDELWARYAGAELPEPPRATFADHEAARVAPTPADLDWWQGALKGYPQLRLPFDGDPGADPAPPYAVHQVAIDAALTERLEAAARDSGVSLFHLLLAGYVRCLARWSGQDDVPVLVARAGRTARLAGIDRMVGPFADTLPVLARVGPGLAGRLRDAWLESERHGSVATVDLARMLAGAEGGPRTVSPASFSFARFPRTGGMVADVVDTIAGTASAATRLGLVCFEVNGALRFSWNYPAALFQAATIERFAAEHLAETAGLAVVERTVSVVDRIRAWSRRTPQGIAVLSDGEPMNYAELDAASDRLAVRLSEFGARRIGLVTAPGAATVVGLLGILKANAAWVPLDAAHPPARLADQLRRAGVEVVVGDLGADGFALLEPRSGADGLVLVDPWDGRDGEPPAVVAEPDDDAYVIFTSGSTGRPKGVAVKHRAMANYLEWAISAFGYRAGDRLAQTASICFDASVRQLLAPLMVGATVVCWDRDALRDPEVLVRRVADDGVTVWSSVPTLWERLLGAAEKTGVDLSALRWVHVGGEELSAAHVRRWFDLIGSGQRIANLYGPTETTINATFHVISERPGDDVRTLPIGRPVGGATVRVTRADGTPCEAGEVGELWIGGVGVAGGYLDDPEQTAAAFVGGWYRSGDLGVLDSDGELWFRGRVDDQVKLHGYRVEPGEVAAVLRSHPAVAGAVVRVEGKRLVAWVESGVEAGVLRTYLEGNLPFYLVPARIEVVSALPLTVTGKIDRSVLPAGGDRPRTSTERVLAGIWERQLDVSGVGREDDFFALGGDSIGVLEVFGALEAEFSALPRPTVMYRRRTLAALAAEIDAASEAWGIDAASEVPVISAEAGSFPLTPSQRGFVLADAVGAESAWLAAPRLHGVLDLRRFQAAVDVLVERHAMLRTVFRPPVQWELESPRSLPVDYVSDPSSVAEELAAERGFRFDPGAWPLVRLRLLRVGPSEHVLVLHAHHLVGDGYSVALLARELLTVHDQESLPPLRSSFRDYVALLDRQEPLIAPYDGVPLGRASSTVTVGTTLGPAVMARVRAVAASLETTPVMPVLAAYRRALGRVLDRPNPAVGVAVTGRDHALPDLSRIFGPCATAVAVRPGPSSSDGFLADVERMATAVAEVRSRSFVAPRGWQFFFTYLDFGAMGPSAGRSLRLTWDDTDAEMAVPPGTDVLLAARPTDEGLRLTIRGRLPEPTLAALAAHVRADLESAAEQGSEAAVPGASAAEMRGQGAEAAASGAVAAEIPGQQRGAEAAVRGVRAGSAVAGGARRVVGRLDSALVGYLPAPRELTALAGMLPEAVRRMLPGLSREAIRDVLFPGGRARLLETVDTPLGRSGFVCLPRFADELGTPGLAGDAAAAAEVAAEQGARTVSLAGMIPAHTGYGAGVARLIKGGVRVTSGHAVTAASVVRTTFAAAGRDLGGRVLAVLGVGSIGSSSLALLLAEATAPPDTLLLCDLPSAAGRLAEFAAELRRNGYPGTVEIAADGVCRADVIIAATSGGARIVDVDRLRPGTVLVDDSFPHCFDTGRALARMRERGDVLIVGGGLLDCGPTTRTVADGLPISAHPGRLPGAIASCQLESLLHAMDPTLPLVCGPVEAGHVTAYGKILDLVKVKAAPLHLLGTVVGS